MVNIYSIALNQATQRAAFIYFQENKKAPNLSFAKYVTYIRTHTQSDSYSKVPPVALAKNSHDTRFCNLMFIIDLYLNKHKCQKKNQALGLAKFF